jgi:hypothetical protein
MHQHPHPLQRWKATPHKHAFAFAGHFNSWVFGRHKTGAAIFKVGKLICEQLALFAHGYLTPLRSRGNIYPCCFIDGSSLHGTAASAYGTAL